VDRRLRPSLTLNVVVNPGRRTRRSSPVNPISVHCFGPGIPLGLSVTLTDLDGSESLGPVTISEVSAWLRTVNRKPGYGGHMGRCGGRFRRSGDTAW